MTYVYVTVQTKTDPNYCSGLDEDRCWQRASKEVQNVSEITSRSSHMDRLPQFVEEYIVVTGSRAVQHDPYLKRTICQGSYTLNLAALSTLGVEMPQNDLKVLQDIQRVQGGAAIPGMGTISGQKIVNITRSYSVQPDGNGGMIVTLIEQR